MKKLLLIMEVSQKQAYIFKNKELKKNIDASYTILKNIFRSIITKKRILYTAEADTPFLYLIMMWKKMTTQEKKIRQSDLQKN